MPFKRELITGDVVVFDDPEQNNLDEDLLQYNGPAEDAFMSLELGVYACWIVTEGDGQFRAVLVVTDGESFAVTSESRDSVHFSLEEV